MLVMTDALTKIVRLRAITSKDATVVASAILQDWVYIYGVPKVIISDQGKEFCNELAKALWSSLSITHTVTSPYHPQTNAQAEVFNKTMAHYLRTAISESKKSTLDWELYLGPLMFAYNTAVHKSTLQSPFYTMFGYDPRVPLWDSQDLLSADERVADRTQAQVLFDIRRTQAAARQIAVSNQQHAQQKQLQGYERSFKPQFSEFQPGDLVWVKTTQVSEPNQKLAPSWEAGIIMERLSAATYKVKREARTRKKLATLNIQRLKPRAPDTPTNPPDGGDTAPPVPGVPPEEGSPAPKPSSSPTTTPRQGPLTRARARQLAGALICAIITCPDDVDDLTEDAIWHLADLGWLPTTCGGGFGLSSNTGSARGGSSGGGSSGSCDGPRGSSSARPAHSAPAPTKKRKIARMVDRLSDFLSPGSKWSKASSAPSSSTTPTFPTGNRVKAKRFLMRSRKK